MGAWGWELLENDSACDEIAQLMSEIRVRAIAASREPLSHERAGVFAAQLALLVRYSPWSFEADDETAALRLAIRTNRAALAIVAPRASGALDQLEHGPLAEDAPLVPLLGAKHAARYLQGIANLAVDETQDVLGEDTAGAYLHVLVTVSPYVDLPRKTVRHWERRLRELIAGAADDDAGLLRFQLKACKALVATFPADDDGGADDDDA
jgi:hypothetical protein